MSARQRPGFAEADERVEPVSPATRAAGQQRGASTIVPGGTPKAGDLASGDLMTGDPVTGGPPTDELTAGPDAFTATLRVEDPRWGERNVTTLVDIVLTACAASAHGPKHPATLDVLFADDAALTSLNTQFRDRNAPTNVLSFPSGEDVGADGSWFLGGIALAYGTCEREARERGINFAHHATHLTLHGVLHLMGYDHERDDDAAQMEQIETEILASLGIADPYEGS